MANKISNTKGAKNPDTQKVSEEVAAFFATNPNAKTVLKVGDSLFISFALGAARDFALRNGLTVETIDNPNAANFVVYGA